MGNTNSYYNRGADFNPDELADGDSLESELDAIQRGFDSIEETISTFNNQITQFNADIDELSTNLTETVDDLSNQVTQFGDDVASKANLNGSSNEKFSVAEAVSDSDAMPKAQAEAMVADINIENITRTLPTKMLTSAHNFFGMLIEGSLYVTSGINSAYQAYIGKGANAHRSVGIDKLAKLYVPTNYPIVDFGGSGLNHWCLDSAGQLFAWGQNAYGQCGLGHTNPVGTPTLCMTGVLKVFDDARFGGYEVSRSSMWVKKTDNTIFCWGENEDGELGLGTTTTVTLPTQNLFCGTDTIFVHNNGGYGGYAVIQKSDNSVYFAGYNTPRQSGLAAGNYSSFTSITSLWAAATHGRIKKICSGNGYNDINGINVTSQNMLILYENSALYSCGVNAQGCCGTGNTTAVTTPTRILSSVTNIENIYSRGASANVMSVLTTDNKYYVWGYNAYGAVGVGSTTDVLTPTLIFSDVTKVFLDGLSCSSYGYSAPHFISRNINGKNVLYACGYNGSEACGVGGFLAGNITTFTKVLIPNDEEVVMMGSYCAGDTGWSQVAITSEGKMYGWGCNDQFTLHYPDSGRISYPQQYTRPDNR